jgi:fatty acid synthase
MINVIRPAILSLVENPKVNRLFVVSNSEGFPGFLKCLQSEPGEQMKICGVWVDNLPTSSLSSLPEKITATSMKVGGGKDAIPQLSADVIQKLQMLGSQIVRVDATTGVIESELRCKSTAPTTYPAPHGVYTVFPNPGQLDEVAFKTQPIPQPGLERVKIAYSALNFRDIMLAYGKLDKDCLVGYSGKGDGWGLEFAGRVIDKSGKPGRRVVGLSTNCIGTQINVDNSLLFDLKDDQNMADYATVPCVYSTSYYSLLVRAKMQPKDSVLIHAGTGGVGQSALHICLRRTKDPSLIFTTCSAKKRPYLIKKFGPLGLRPENIGNSRDISFEQLIMERTSGRGVDIVLNSLDGESLQASWRVVAPFGRFCEIGKYDLMQNTGLPMQVFLKNISFLGIDLDQIMDMPEEWALIHDLVTDGIKSGEVQPLDRRVFEANEVTEAFRFMGAGTHVGKVLIKFGSEDNTAYDKEPKMANIPNFFANTPKAYLVIGGLGGFGLEFAQWLSKHGVKKIILSSRGKVRNGNQARAISEMQARGSTVEICNVDFTSYENVKNFLVKQPLAGFFNLGAVLADGLWKNMTANGWETPCHAKTAVTDNFDRALRATNQTIDHFVTWSSVSAGHGNAGQTNYGYANSTLDAIVRRRNNSGESGLSIQWGAISDVGLLAKEDSKASGNVAAAYMPQPMASCLSELEKLLSAKSQGVHELYVSGKRSLGEGADSGAGNLPLKVAGIIGMANNMAEIENTPFENLGVDSLQVMEIQNSIKKATGQKNCCR